MKLQFLQSPWLALLIPAGVVWLWMLHRRARTPARAPRRALVIQALAALCLIFAAAGLSVRHSARKIQIVVAADVSDSVFELNGPTARIRELLGALDPESTEAAVVVFGDNAGLERGMAPLPARNFDSNARMPVGRASEPVPVPDLEHRVAVVKTDGTDIAGAIQFSRSAFTSPDCTRAILLLSDFRDTRALNNQSALAGAAFLSGSDVALLVTPTVLSASSDVQLVELRAPESASVERAVPLEITVASQQPVTVVVSVRRGVRDQPTTFVESKTVQLEAAPAGTPASTELRKTVRILDHPKTPGVVVYTAEVSGADGPIPGDVSGNNKLSAAVRVIGPSKWAVLARANSTLADLARNATKPLGVESKLFTADKLPADESAYREFAGVLVDGLSAKELPDNGSALRALANAIEGGKALIAVGGDAAFGAGGHPRDGGWEKLLPIEMTPEDDRARAVLFLIDVSKSMDEKFLHNGTRIRKMDFAAEQLQVVTQLRPQDRLGLIEFSGDAKLTAPLSDEPTRSKFLDAVHAIQIVSNTDILRALEEAKIVLDADNADEKLVILISDGIQTVTRSPEEFRRSVEALCPRGADGKSRTKLMTFGIDVEQNAGGAGEELLKQLAAWGGGKYSADFPNLRKIIGDIIGSDGKDYYTRREAFAMHASALYPWLPSSEPWPVLNFRNRVKARSSAETVLSSAPTESNEPAKKARSDPLLVLSGPRSAALGRRAALAWSLDGAEGAKLLASGSAARKLLPNLLSWAEAREESAANGISLLAEPRGNDELELELRAFNPSTGEPESALTPVAMLTTLPSADADVRAESEPLSVPLRASAPGMYRGSLRAPPAAVCRLSVADGNRPLAERFVSTSCAAEKRRFGVDRAAMAELAAKAGAAARVIESPRDLAQWASEQSGASGVYELRGWLVALALGLLLSEYAMRRR